MVQETECPEAPRTLCCVQSVEMCCQPRENVNNAITYKQMWFDYMFLWLPKPNWERTNLQFPNVLIDIDSLINVAQ